MNKKTRTLFPALLLLLGFSICGLSFPAAAQTGTEGVIQLAANGQGRAYAVAYSPDGATLAVGSSLGITLYRTADLAQVMFIPSETWVRALSYSPDGKWLASGSYDPIVRLWRASDGTLERELSGHTAWVRALAFSPDGETLATASDDNTLRLWAIPGGEVKSSFEQGMEGVRAVAFSPDGSLLASGGFDNTIRLWQVADGSLVRELRGHEGWVRALAFSPDGYWLASGGFDASLRLWQVSDGSLLVTRLEHSSSVLGVAFSPDGKTLVSASVDASVRLWTLPSLEPYDLLLGHTDFVFSVGFSPDGTTLASGSADNSVRVWVLPGKANPAAYQEVITPSNCKSCHHPSSAVHPARVIETSCATCHREGALGLNWCPVLDRAPGGTTLDVNYSIAGTEGGVPQGTPGLSVVIDSPGNGEHLYTPEEIIGLVEINGHVYPSSQPLKDIEVTLEIWSGTELVTTLAVKPGSGGVFAFSANIRTGGGDPYVDLDGQKFLCANCHKKGMTVLPEGDVRLVVTATAPDGESASDERRIYVDHSAKIPMEVKVLTESGEPVAGIHISASTRLYEWRAHTFTASTDPSGHASLFVEALSGVPTRYQVSVPATLLNGVLYQSKGSIEVNLPAGAGTAPTVTLYLQANSAEINGQVSGLSAPIQLWVFPVMGGAAQTVMTTEAGSFKFEGLPINQYLLAADPQALADMGLRLDSQRIDLSQVLSAQVSLVARAAEGTSLGGKFADESGTALPFAWINLEGQTGQSNPATGAYVFYGLPAGKGTAILSAPGYYSQANVVDLGNSTMPVRDFNLVIRPETRFIPWGDGQVILPPETDASWEAQTILFEQGWLWGQGGEVRPMVIQWGTIQIRIPQGHFAMERLPAREGWLYVLDGTAEIQHAGGGAATTVKAGEMIFLSQEKAYLPVQYDPVVVSALRQGGEIPIQPAWQSSLSAQVRDRLARIGIGTAQAMTFITYFMEILALLGMVVLAVKWVVKKDRKDKSSE